MSEAQNRKESPPHQGRIGDGGDADSGGWEQNDEKVTRDKQGDLAAG